MLYYVGYDAIFTHAYIRDNEISIGVYDTDDMTLEVVDLRTVIRSGIHVNGIEVNKDGDVSADTVLCDIDIVVDDVICIMLDGGLNLYKNDRYYEVVVTNLGVICMNDSYLMSVPLCDTAVLVVGGVTCIYAYDTNKLISLAHGEESVAQRYYSTRRKMMEVLLE